MQHTLATFREKIDSPSGLVSFVFFQPQETFTFDEGQFMMITHQNELHTLKKPYSIATTNKFLQEDKRIGFIVKKTSEHGMSDFLTTHRDYTVTLTWPVGHYRDNHIASNYLFVSTGSGLSPNMGILNKLLETSLEGKQVVFLFGERYLDNLLPDMQSFMRENVPWLTMRIFLSKESGLPDGYTTGYVQDGLTEAIQHLGTNTACFICGQPIMVQDVQQRLIDLGVDKKNITVEKY